jgi:GNAT superfamily N-acetyltransferase
VETGDRAVWERLFRGYNAFYGASVADAVIELTWQRLLAGGEGGLIALVAVDDADAPIGLAHLLFHRSTWSPTWYCYLEDLFVDPAERRKGVGLALIEAAYREADARGCTRTYWMTQETNATARALYDRVASRAPFVQYRR